jgi:hypothetical protein
MRTTLSLDDDVVADLHSIQKESGRTWKDVVNDVLRAGVRARHAEQRSPRRIRRTKGVRLGAPKLGDISNVHETLALVEGDERR